MATKMFTCYTDQTAVVKKYLEEDWEPFAVFPVKAKKNDVFVTRLKIYFRKTEFVIGEVGELVSAPVDQEFKDLVTELTTSLATFHKEMQLENQKFTYDILDTMTRALQVFESSVAKLSTKVETLNTVQPFVMPGQPEHVEPDLDDDEEPTVIERKEALGNTKVEVDEDAEPVTGGSPDGDGFRVVDDIPVDLVNTTRTEAQERAIEEIRSRNDGVNISVFSPDTEGMVKLLAGSWVYKIQPNGAYSAEDTGANTNSLMV